jgi:hypothetical protein
MSISNGDTNETCPLFKGKEVILLFGGGALTTHCKFIAGDVDKHKIKT